MPCIEIHTTEIRSLYRKHYPRCCGSAETIDTVANQILECSQAFRKYLVEFDQYIAQVANYSSNLTRRLMNSTKGKQAFASQSIVVDISGFSVRSVQIIMAFAAADETLRHASYLYIRRTLEDRSYDRIADRIVKELNVMIRGIYRIHKECVERAQVILDGRMADYLVGTISNDDLRKSKMRKMQRNRIDPSRPAFPPQY